MKKMLVLESWRPIEGLSGSLFNRRECVLDVASSAAEAMAVTGAEPPDLVLVDEDACEIEPEDFVRGLAAAAGRAIPVVFVVDDHDPAVAQRLLADGASAVFAHPVDELELNATVCDLLGITLRRHLRTFVKMKVDATIGHATHFATISNISPSGVLIECDRPVHLGDIVKLAFFLPDDDVPITVIAKVVREAPGEAHSYGCQFLDLADKGRARLHEFCAQVHETV